MILAVDTCRSSMIGTAQTRALRGACMLLLVSDSCCHTYLFHIDVAADTYIHVNVQAMWAASNSKYGDKICLPADSLGEHSGV